MVRVCHVPLPRLSVGSNDAGSAPMVHAEPQLLELLKQIDAHLAEVTRYMVDIPRTCRNRSARGAVALLVDK